MQYTAHGHLYFDINSTGNDKYRFVAGERLRGYLQYVAPAIVMATVPDDYNPYDEAAVSLQEARKGLLSTSQQKLEMLDRQIAAIVPLTSYKDNP
jgi:hypothetical protein